MEPRKGQVQAGGLRFGTLEWGEAGAPLALLLHGYPDTAWTWRHLGPRLAAAGWHAVAPFTRGYAPTDLAPNGRYRVADLVRDAVALRDTLGGDAPAVLIGHDWGAVTVWGATAAAPEAFAGYVALSVPPPPALLAIFGSPRTLPVGLRQLRMSWYFLYNQLPGAERTLDRLIPRLWRDWSPGYDAAEDLEGVFAALDRPERRRAALRYYADNLRGGALEAFTLRPRAPALYLHGAADGCMQAAVGAAHPELLASGSDVRVIPGAGHFLQLEAPEAVGAAIESWIGAPPRSGG